MHLSERSYQAIEACYDAAFAPERWPAALQLLAESVGAHSCTFATCDPVTDPIRMPRSEGHEDFAQLWLSNDAHAPDPHPVRASAFAKGRGRFVLEEQVSTEVERRTLPYYQETARPGGRDWWACVCFPVEARWWGLQLYRGAVPGPFTAAEALYATRLDRSLSRTIGFAEKCSGALLVAGLNALERFKVAALVLDQAGVAKHSNLAAERLMGPDFRLRRGRPVSGDPRSNRRLQAMLAASLDTRSSRTAACDPIVIERAGAPWLFVEAMPITAFGSDLFSSGRLILTLTDLASPSVADVDILMLAYGLTRAEARLAVEIASGRSVDEAAANLGNGRETARTQLKAVFGKTNTSRQAELASVLARLRGVKSNGSGINPPGSA
jgi:DNA-binding CsgD family transcriptional regulator